MSAPWPPPPDLESLKELVREADVEGFIMVHGAPPDEYDTEAEALHTAIAHYSTADLTVANLLPVLEPIWQEHFSLREGEEFALRRPALLGLAQQIERFFGPEARPQVRGG